jgi:hypothetical protein
MMKAVLAILALFTVMAIPTLPQAAPATTGGELNGWCKIFNRDVMPSDPGQAFNGGLCQGFINGWMQGVSNLSWSDEKGGVHIVTVADAFSVAQLAKVFVAYVDRHSEVENKPADYAMAKAIQDEELLASPLRSTKEMSPSRGVPRITQVSRIVVPYTPGSSGLLQVAVTINGVPGDAILDTGASEVTGNFGKYGIERTGEKKFSVATGDTKLVGTGFAVVCVQHVCLKVATDDTSANTTSLLGQSFIKLFQSVTIDRASHTITFVPGPPKSK